MDGVLSDIFVRFDHYTDYNCKAALILPYNSNTLTLSYNSLHRETNRLKTILLTSVLSAGDRIAIYLPNGLPFVVSFLAVSSIGCVACPLNSAYKKDEVLFYLGDTRPKLLIVPPKSDWDSKEAREAALELGIPIWEISSCSYNGIITVNRPDLCPKDLDRLTLEASSIPDDVCLILHTSGTTSRPKAVPLRHRNLMSSLANISATYNLSDSDRALVVMPLFHVHGLIGVLLSTLMSGGTAVIPPKFSASKFWPLMAEHRCTWFSAVPTIHQILLRHAARDFDTLNPRTRALIRDSMRFARSCSASLPAPVLGKLEAKFGVPVLEAYGMSEAAHQMSSNPLPPRSRKPGSVGVPTGVEVVILDDKNREMSQGSTGEISIRGPNVTCGYLNNEEANRKCFCFVESRQVTFFRTGDQGYFDADGYLFLTGRLKELINRAGEKISPVEIDAVLTAHPAVGVAVAFGIPDTVYGEEVWAAVIPVGEARLTESEMKLFCSSKLPKFKCPKRIFITDDVPRTATGKIQRRVVSAHFQKMSRKSKL
eukprot:211521_1